MEFNAVRVNEIIMGGGWTDGERDPSKGPGSSVFRS